MAIHVKRLFGGHGAERSHEQLDALPAIAAVVFQQLLAASQPNHGDSH